MHANLKINEPKKECKNNEMYKFIKKEEFNCPADINDVSDEIGVKAYYRVSVPWFLTSVRRVMTVHCDSMYYLKMSAHHCSEECSQINREILHAILLPSMVIQVLCYRS